VACTDSGEKVQCCCCVPNAVLDRGDSFHTIDSAGNKAYAEKFDTIRTKPDRTTANNLHSLGACQ